MPIRSDIYNYFVGIRACLKMNRLKEAITRCEMGLAVSFILGLLLGRFHGNSFFFSWHKSSSGVYTARALLPGRQPREEKIVCMRI